MTDADATGVSGGSVMRCRVSDGIKPNHWSAGVTNSCNNLILVQLLTPPTSLIGRARLSVDTMRRETAPDSASSMLTMSLADEYDIITGGYDVKELQVSLNYLLNFNQSINQSIYRPHSRGDNMFGSVHARVRPFVCGRSPV